MRRRTKIVCTIGSPSIIEKLIQTVRLSLEIGAATQGDLIVITAGIPIGTQGTTNLLKVQRVE